MSEKIELNPEYYDRLGRILVAFQDLEQSITFSLIRLTRTPIGDDIDKEYVKALSELSFRSRLKLLRNLAEKLKVSDFMYSGCPHEDRRPDFFRELINRLKKHAIECQALEDKRNQYIHSVWSPSESDADRIARRFKVRVQSKKTSFVHDEVPIEELNEVLRNIENNAEMIDFLSHALCSVQIEKRKSNA